jgi:16S rRNA (cytidine1402-2'-O)-methyltransferase
VLHFVPTPIGNLGDITVRSLGVLSDSETVFCEDSRVTKQLFRLLYERYPNYIAEKERNFIPLHHHNHHKVLKSVDFSIFDSSAVYVSDAGMPSISDPGVELLRFARENSIEFEVLPGPSASPVATVLSGFTDKENLFIGFLPHKGAERDRELQKALTSGYTITLFESPHRLQKLLNELSESVPKRQIFLVKEISKKFEKRWWGSAVELAEIFKSENIRGEWVAVIDGEERSGGSLSEADISELQIPPKVKAKLLSKLTGRAVKEIYRELSQ